MIIMGDIHLRGCFEHTLKENRGHLKKYFGNLYVKICRKHFSNTLWNSFIFTIYIVNYQEEMVWEGNVSAL